MVDDKELPESISPLTFTEPFSSMTNHTQVEDNIPIEDLIYCTHLDIDIIVLILLYQSSFMLCLQIVMCSTDIINHIWLRKVSC